jgi:hypothetical protein
MPMRFNPSKRNYGTVCFAMIVVAGASILSLAADQHQEPQVLAVSASGEWRQVPANREYGKQKAIVFGQHLDVGSGCLYGSPNDGESVVLKCSNPSDTTLYAFPCEKWATIVNPDCK